MCTSSNPVDTGWIAVHAHPDGAGDSLAG